MPDTHLTSLKLKSASEITALTDSTTGTAGDEVDDTTASVKDDIASLAAKINEIIAVLNGE
jgi:hypothetical protein